MDTSTENCREKKSTQKVGIGESLRIILTNKLFSLFDNESSLVDEEFSSKLNSREEKEMFFKALNSLKSGERESEKVMLDGEEIEISLK